MGTDGEPLEQLRTALDALVDADPAALAGRDAVVALHRQLARLEAVAAGVAGAFERGGPVAGRRGQDGLGVAGAAVLAPRAHGPAARGPGAGPARAAGGPPGVAGRRPRGLERVVFEGGDRPLNVGASRRFFTGADRRAVEVRDQECAWELCDTPAEDCEVDHVVPFAEGGPTVVDNGRLACGFHNRSRPGASRPVPPEEAEEDERGPP